jgi:hypothetical protein
MSRLTFAMFIIAVLLVAGALGFSYATDRIGSGTLAFVGIVMLALGVISAIFVRKMGHPDMSVEQMLYKTDHPTRT